MLNSLSHRQQDSLERRLIWTVPGACGLGLCLLWLAAFALAPVAQPADEVKPVDAQLIELPPPARNAAHQQASAKPVQTPPSTQQTQAATQAKTTTQTATPAPTTPKENTLATAPQNATSDADKLGSSSGARAIVSPLPKIPDDLRDEALNTTVTVRFHIAADGSVNVELTQPTSNPRLNRILLETLQQWRFFPAVENNHPVASIQELRIKIR